MLVHITNIVPARVPLEHKDVISQTFWSFIIWVKSVFSSIHYQQCWVGFHSYHQKWKKHFVFSFDHQLNEQTPFGFYTITK